MWAKYCTSGCLLEENKNTNLRRYRHLNILCSIISSRQEMEAAEVSVGR